MTKMHKSFRIDILNAKANPDLSREFYRGHHEVLSEMRIDKLDSANPEWTQNPSVYMIICFEEDKMVAGARIHKFHEQFKLPFEIVLANLNPQYLRISDHEQPLKYGESCGLWVHKDYRKIGIKQMLMRYKMVCAKHMNLDHLYGICPRHTFDHFRTIGFIHCSFKNQILEFPYPSEKFQTIAVKCNTSKFKYAFWNEQKIMNSLYENPFQKIISTGKKASSIFEINSSIKSRSEILLEKHRTVRIQNEIKKKDWI